MKRLLSRYLISTMCSLSFFPAFCWGCLLVCFVLFCFVLFCFVFFLSTPAVSLLRSRSGRVGLIQSPPPPGSSGSQGGNPRVHQKLSYPSLNLFIYSLSHP